VCPGRVFVTIRWLERTRVSSQPADRAKHHISDFSAVDFQGFLMHASVRGEYRDRIEVFSDRPCALPRWWFGDWMYPNFLPHLQH